MLVFVGLGLHDDKGISLKGLDEARGADAVYGEFYTSVSPGLDIKRLEHSIGKPIHVVDRRVVEENPKEILDMAKVGKVVFLIPGDPMVATTHVDLRLRAARAGIQTKIVHAPSIMSATAGLTGLQSYKFGRSATVPFQDNPSWVPYETLVENLKRGLHTLLFLDLRTEENRVMTANEAMEIMLALEEKIGQEIFTVETLGVVVARAGSDEPLVMANKVARLRGLDFGMPPHVIVVPGKLHFLEAEALKVFANAPEDVIK